MWPAGRLGRKISALPFKEPETGIHHPAAHVSLLVGVSVASTATDTAAFAAALPRVSQLLTVTGW